MYLYCTKQKRLSQRCRFRIAQRQTSRCAARISSLQSLHDPLGRCTPCRLACGCRAWSSLHSRTVGGGMCEMGHPLLVPAPKGYATATCYCEKANNSFWISSLLFLVGPKLVQHFQSCFLSFPKIH